MPVYTGDPIYDRALAFGFAFALLTAVAASFVKTPYGRFADERFGVALGPRMGWLLMELPASLSFAWFFWQAPLRDAPFALFVAAVWTFHYGNRGFVMPLLMRVPRGQKSSFSLMVVVMGWVVTALHGYLSATWAARLSPYAVAGDLSFLSRPSFVIGFSLYAAAMVGNLHSDHVLRSLRTREEVRAGKKVYRVPRGGLFRFVTSPSYLTELLAWLGFAIFTWSLAGVYILAVSMANLVPRALASHRWYHERFDDYPSERKVLIPGIW